MQGSRPALAIGLAMLVLLGGFYGTLAGALVGLAELVRLPAILIGVALACLARGGTPFPAIAGWFAMGLVAALVLRGAVAALGAAEWLPTAGEELTGADLLLDAGWLCILALLAFRGAVPGAILVAIVATTRVGAWVEMPAAILGAAWSGSTSVISFSALGLQALAGVLAAGLVMLGAGWLLARGARAAAGLAPPAILLAALGLIAAAMRLWELLGSRI
ncbi:hypothetical protein KTR66_15115 [Roseococcus sp. SDR]|uniref:hypothetical protein n=1 Tax=Roseococcus sp. SDR TaxID=2835532 RepID=UPI001BCD30EC|nr:hypothetical protein [Roseococcus sp. SDR]MBS7791332.1 hypothetical protein [Roseococcus sp. SDR]MBV1846646.1 hypothetical protein [Roseococcus sp. SDR]